MFETIHGEIMMKWLQGIFKPRPDSVEIKIKELFRFLFDQYGFSYTKADLGDLCGKDGKLLFYGPLYAYQMFCDILCINVVYLVQRGDFDIYLTAKPSAKQQYIFDGIRLPSELAYDLPRFASEIRSELLRSGTIYGKTIERG